MVQPGNLALSCGPSPAGVSIKSMNRNNTTISTDQVKSDRNQIFWSLWKSYSNCGEASNGLCTSLMP